MDRRGLSAGKIKERCLGKIRFSLDRFRVPMPVRIRWLAMVLVAIKYSTAESGCNVVDDSSAGMAMWHIVVRC